MKRSKNITLIMMTAIAACATSCDETKPVDEGEIKHCVDQDGVVQEESKCTDVPDAPHDHDGSAPHHASGGGHFWYYGGTRTTPGTKVTGGSYRPTPGRTYSPPSRTPMSGGGGHTTGGGGTPSIGKGGFGGAGAGHGGGGGS